jgi:hypothetical protein
VCGDAEMIAVIKIYEVPISAHFVSEGQTTQTLTVTVGHVMTETNIHTCIFAGGPNNFKSYHHIVCYVSSANLRLSVKTRPKHKHQNLPLITCLYDYTSGFIFKMLWLHFPFQMVRFFVLLSKMNI